MNTRVLRELRQHQLLRAFWAQDGHIRLRVKRVYLGVKDLRGADCVIFDVVEQSSGKTAGEIALRIGESEALFYLGHIGYHIDPPFQGHRFAARACALCGPLLKRLGMLSAVITTDEDNEPSIRTCENLGCEMECSVDVPNWCVEEFQISERKRRYIFDCA